MEEIGEQRMTHNELLAKIVEKEPGTLTYSDGEILHSTRRLTSWQLALRAVAELHKPIWIDADIPNWCTESCGSYPCNTIQAIEGQLK